MADDVDWVAVARRNARSVQTTVGWIFWDPGAVDRYGALGLPGPLGYIVARAAPLLAAGPDASKPPALREWPQREDEQRAPAAGQVEPARIAAHWLREANAVLQALAAPNRNESIASAP